MVKDVRSPGTRAPRHSLSPKRRGRASRRNISDEYLISCDEPLNLSCSSDEVDGDTSEDDTDHSFSELIEEQEGPRLRSPCSRVSQSKSAFTVLESARIPFELLDCSSDRDEYTRKRPKKDSTSSSRLLGIYLIVVVVTVCLLAYLTLVEDRLNNNRQDRISIKAKHPRAIEDFKDNVRKIRKHFPSQDSRIWSDIAAGVNEVIDGAPEPWIFVLFSNEKMELLCLANMLGNASSDALHTNGSLQLFPEDLNDDYGLVIEHFKPRIFAKRAVVVYDVLNITPQAIQAFHTMCDRVAPLVEGVVYILTILTSGDIPEFENPVIFVENQLRSRFVNKVPDEKLQPLITRLTDGPLIPVKSELGLRKCPL